jgi:uncharacterized membrane protein
MRVRLQRLWEELGRSFWFVPALMALGALGLALLMVQVDAALRALQPRWMAVLYIEDPSGARSVLATLAGSQITVAGVLFSVTILVLNMASAQFGPRLIPNFMRQGATQIVLGIFVGSFIYSLAVLSMIRGGRPPFIPQAAVALGLVFGVVSFGVLVYFLHRVAVFIQAPRIVDDVARRLEKSILEAFPARDPARPVTAHAAQEAGATFDGPTLVSRRAGYVQGIDVDSLLETARRHDGRIRLLVAPGQYVAEGDPLARLAGGLADAEQAPHTIRVAIVLGPQRTQTQDPAFGVYQLVEIGVRALSAGINDPFTAVSCVDRLGNALGRLAERDEPTELVRDADGAVRLQTRPCTHAVMVHAAFDQLRRAAADHLNVVLRMVSVLERLLSRDPPPGFRAALRAQAEAIGEEMAGRSLVGRDRRDFDARYAALERRLRP